MPTVVKSQPTGAYTEGGQNIGAVIFDKPALDTLQVAFKVGEDMAEVAKQKAVIAQQEKAQNAKIVADLDFDAKGAFPDDTEYFKNSAEKLKNTTVNVLGLNPNTPQYQKALKDAQLEQSFMQLDANESAKQWEQYKEIWGKYNPEKHDPKVFDAWNAKVRLTRNPRERRELFKESPLQDRVKDFGELLGERNSKGLYKPSVIEKQVNKGGIRSTESTEEYTPQDVIRYADAIVDGDNDMAESAQKGLDALAQKNRNLYDEINNEAKQLGVDPLKLYTRKQLINSGLQKKEIKNVAFDPYYVQGASYAYGNKDMQDGVNFIVEQGANLLNGNPESYTIAGQTTAPPVIYSGGGGIPQIGGGEPKGTMLSDQFQGMKMGKYSVDDYERNSAGDILTDVNGNPISKRVAKDNTVLKWKWVDGTPYIKTEETLYNAGKKVDGVQVDSEGFKPATKNDVERIIVSNVAPNQVQKALEAYRSKLTKEGAYKERIAKPTEMQGQSKQTLGAKPTEQKKSSKEVSLSTIKSKVGTKGFEGYTEKELVDYYKSQGYTIK